jgi:hypothetical protein
VRKNLLLTFWLALPILVFAGLVWWIFASGARPSGMDAEPVGPGAGDTGGANALGEWLAGRSPNDVERANIARRQGRDVDPFWWPGGTRVVVEDAGSDADRGVTIGWLDGQFGVLRSVALRAGGDGAWSSVLRDQRPAEGSLIYVCRGAMAQRIRDGRSDVVGADGQILVPVSVRPVSTEGVAASDPIPLLLTLPG